MTTRIAQQNLLVGQEASSVDFTPAGESQALTCTVTELVADSVVRMVVINSRGLVQDSLIVNGTGEKKLIIDKTDGAVTVRVEQLQGSGQVQVTDPSGGAVEAADLADNSVTNAKMADSAVDTDELVDLAVETAKIRDLAVTTAKIEDLNVTEGKLALGIGAQSPAIIADPGAAGTITPVAPVTTVAITDVAGERTLADPAFDGQIVIFSGGGGNAPTLVPTTGDWDGTNGTYTFSAAADRVAVIGLGAEWRELGNVDVVAS